MYHLTYHPIIESAKEVLWPTRCVGCEAHGELLCDKCERELAYIERADACPRCAAPHGRLVCTECYGRDGALPFNFTGAASAFEFLDTAARMVAIYKDQNERRLSAILAAFMVEAIPADWIIWADAICYVPCDKRALRRRGFDHMAHVAFEISRLTGLPIADFLLKSPISDQRGLGRKERQANLNGAFGVYVPSGHIAKDARNILLIDDVFTTGATLNAAAGALLEAGASEVRVATVTRVY